MSGLTGSSKPLAGKEWRTSALRHLNGMDHIASAFSGRLKLVTYELEPGRTKLRPWFGLRAQSL